MNLIWLCFQLLAWICSTEATKEKPNIGRLPRQDLVEPNEPSLARQLSAACSATLTEGIYSSASLGATQKVINDPSGGSNFFELPAYLSDNPSCLASEFHSTGSSGSMTATSMDNPVLRMGRYVVQPQASFLTQDAIYTFYVRVGTSALGSVFYFGPYTLQVGCPSSLTYSLVLPAGFSSVQFVAAGAGDATSFIFDKFGTSESSCPVASYQVVSDTDGSTVLSSFSVQQASPTSMRIVPPDLTTAASYKFKIKAIFNLATVSDVTLTCELVVGCPSTRATPIIIGTFPTGYSAVQKVSNPTTTTAELVYHTESIASSNTACSLTFTIVVATADSVHPNIDALIVVTSNGYLQLKYLSPTAGGTHHLQSYENQFRTFRIKAESPSGDVAFTSIYTWYFGCDQTLIAGMTITTGSFPAGKGLVQFIPFANLDMNPYFLPEFITSEPTCPWDQFKNTEYLVQPGTETPVSAWFSRTPARFQINSELPEDKYTYDVIIFKSNLGGVDAYFRVISNLVFFIGCPPGHPETVITETPQSFTFTFVIGSAPILMTYQVPTTNCEIYKNEIIDSSFDSSGNSGAAIINTHNFPTDTEIESELLNRVGVISFKVRSHYSDVVVFDSSLFTITLACGIGSVAFTFDLEAEYTFQQFDTSSNVLSFPPAGCAVPDCCTTLTYYALSSATGYPIGTLPGISTPTLQSNGKVEATVDTSAVASYDLHLAVANGVDHAIAAPARINIIFSCTQEVFALSDTSLKTTEFLGEVQATGPNGLAFKQLNLTLDGSKLSSYELSIGDRFLRTLAPASQCLLEDYRIDKVMDADGETVSIDGLKLTSRGRLIVSNLQKRYRDLEVYVAASNGGLWSSSAVTGPLVKLTIIGGTITVPNVAPIFLEPLSKVELLDVPAEIKLPEVFDANGDEVEIIADQEWAKIENGVLKIADPGTAGEVSVRLTLKDGKGGETSYVQELIITMQDPTHSTDGDEEQPNPPPSQGGSKPSSPRPRLPPGGEAEEPDNSELAVQYLDPKIKSISPFGLVRIEFNDTLDSEGLQLKTSDLRLKIISSDPELPNLSSCHEADKLCSANFTWEQESWTKKSFLSTSVLQIQLRFQQPLLVSQSLEQDRLIVEFLPRGKEAIEQRAEQGKYILTSTVLASKIRKQIAETTATKAMASAAESTSMSLQWVFVINLILNHVFSGGMIIMLQLTRALQIILHLPLLRVALPANTSFFFSILIPVATFDMLDPDWTSKLVFKFDDPEQERLAEDLLDQMEDLGYETHNAILNLGSIFIFLSLYTAKLLIFLMKWLSLSLFGKGSPEKVESMSRKIFFGEIFSLLLDTYFELLISGVLELKNPLDTTNGEQSAEVVGWIALFLALIFLPGSLVYTQARFNKLKSSDFKERWGALYDGIKVSSRWEAAYYTFFTGRRALFVSMTLLLRAPFIFQMFELLALNMAIIIYHGYWKPHQLRLLNYIELVNEVFISTISFHLLLFTDFVPDPETRALIGWSMNLVTALCILFNLVFILYFGGRRVVLIVIKYRRIFIQRRLHEQEAAKEAETTSDQEGTVTSKETVSKLSLSSAEPDHSTDPSYLIKVRPKTTVFKFNRKAFDEPEAEDDFEFDPFEKESPLNPIILNGRNIAPLDMEPISEHSEDSKELERQMSMNKKEHNFLKLPGSPQPVFRLTAYSKHMFSNGFFVEDPSYTDRSGSSIYSAPKSKRSNMTSLSEARGSSRPPDSSEVFTNFISPKSSEKSNKPSVNSRKTSLEENPHQSSGIVNSSHPRTSSQASQDLPQPENPVERQVFQLSSDSPESESPHFEEAKGEAGVPFEPSTSPFVIDLDLFGSSTNNEHRSLVITAGATAAEEPETKVPDLPQKSSAKQQRRPRSSLKRKASAKSRPRSSKKKIKPPLPFIPMFSKKLIARRKKSSNPIGLEGTGGAEEADQASKKEAQNEDCDGTGDKQQIPQIGHQDFEPSLKQPLSQEEPASPKRPSSPRPPQQSQQVQSDVIEEEENQLPQPPDMPTSTVPRTSLPSVELRRIKKSKKRKHRQAEAKPLKKPPLKQA